MNAPYDVERDLTRWMAAVVPTRAPDDLTPSVVARTRSMRPRPGWLARLLEPPVDTSLHLRRIGFARSARPVLIVLLLIALLAGVAVVGSQLVRSRPLPAPFGVAVNGTIAIDVGGTLFVMRSDGSDLRALALPYTGVTKASFARDGTRFAAWATPDATQADMKSIIVANADGSASFEVSPARFEHAPLSVPALGGINQLSWSPDGRLIAFSDQFDRLHLVDVGARSIRELAPDTTISARRDPSWAPDGRLAYRCRTQDGELHLCVMNADLASERVVPTSRGTDWAFQHPSWSHDGRLIAYYVDDVTDKLASTPGYDIATIDPDVGVERILTHGTVDDMIVPDWTPDGRSILAFGAIIAADGSGVRYIGEGRCGWTVPSPDGRQAVCLAEDRQLELWPIAGGRPTIIPLGGPAGSGTFPAWQREAS